MRLPRRFGVVRYGGRQRFLQPVNSRQNRAETGRHPVIGVGGNAPHQPAYPRPGIAAPIHIPHPQNLVPQVGHRIVALPGGDGVRFRRPAIYPQGRAQPHIGNAARQENRGAHHLVHGGFLQH